ncbi:YcgJ family protein [Sulfurovum riftiae]|uniref:Uncharacterized protein n=1 Tax=Sulfurovum riftiae TaxID=1630136 RepID=A0A151CDW7_9BACT|nr:YcgJ family protein [Sulfurovum riftiae]KYJ85715.1 hypothetical protein AS592_02965 [Sulfurovum riftiae]
MKLKLLTATALILGLSTFATAKGNVYSPDHGIICDKKSGFCVDSEGISMAFTEEYLGKKAADKFRKMTEGVHMDMSSYTLSNGLSCDSKKRICKKSKWDDKADKHWTNILFGK